jgi:hypothetical protein
MKTKYIPQGLDVFVGYMTLRVLSEVKSMPCFIDRAFSHSFTPHDIDKYQLLSAPQAAK